VIELDDVVVPGSLAGASLQARKGEVLGLVGLEGAGHDVVLDVLFGSERPTSGTMKLSGRVWRPRSPIDAVEAGLAFVPADRARAGLMLDRSITDNVNHVRLGLRSRRARLVRRRDAHRRATRWVERLGIRTGGVAHPVSTLSGGNQQKVVLAKWLEVAPSVILLNDPTRGVDVGGKDDIYAIIRELAQSGATVLFTSTELVEFKALCDRVLIFSSGRVIGSIPAAAADEHTLLEAVNTGQVPRSDDHDRSSVRTPITSTTRRS
jgi:ABC-type sugar transport system ATPase subunit